MRTLVLHPKFRHWRLVMFCLLSMLTAFSIAWAQDRPVLENHREFWVWDLTVMPPGFRKAQTTLRGTGSRSLLYVEDKLWGQGLNADFMNRLQWQLETSVPSGALTEDQGIIPLEESLFGTLPSEINRDERLVVLFADLGQYKNQQFDGFFNAFDQLREADAWEKYKQHSNETNIIYLNGLRRDEAYTTGVIAHELQHLLAQGRPDSERESWLSEMLAEGAMLITGFFTDQPHVNRFAAQTWKYPLVTLGYVSYGSQLLFSSFLLDSLPNGSVALSAISRNREPGKSAVERVFREQSGAPLSFDAIFSNFVSYAFTQANNVTSLPYSWKHPENGIVLPEISPYFTFKAGSGELEGRLAPYSFLAIDLAQELGPSVVIQTERIDDKENPNAPPRSCSKRASVLWKPIAPTRIALYAVGCEPQSGTESVAFRLKILDQPSFIPASPFRILP